MREGLVNGRVLRGFYDTVKEQFTFVLDCNIRGYVFKIPNRESYLKLQDSFYGKYDNAVFHMSKSALESINNYMEVPEEDVIELFEQIAAYINYTYQEEVL